MKLRLILLLLVMPIAAKAQDQFYSTVDVTANVLEVAYDKQLLSTLSGTNAIIIAGVKGSPYSGSWYGPSYGPAMWVRLNKTVSCAGQDIDNFIVLPLGIAAMPASYASSYPNTPWYAGGTSDDYPFIKNLFTTAYLNNLQVKITKVVCGVSQTHPVKKQLVPVAYIQGPEYFSILPPNNTSISSSAWINGVQLTSTNSAPTNAITTLWSFTIPASTNYDIYAHWVSNKNTVSAISYSVDGQTSKNAALDQNINAGIWVKLIKNTNYSAGNHTLNIAVDATANYVVDGIKVEKTAL